VLTNDAAVRIAYETGISDRWLLAADTAKPPVDKDSEPYTPRIILSVKQPLRRKRNNLLGSRSVRPDIEPSRCLGLGHHLDIVLEDDANAVARFA